MIFRHYVKRFRVHAAYGALAGLTWFFLYDQFLCPHGQSTLTRHMIAYTIGGSLVTMTIWNPASFFYGGVIGAIVGGYIANRDTKPTPAGF